MQDIEYRVTYSGVHTSNGVSWRVNGEDETIIVKARDINSGYSKALKIAKQPLGNGTVREIVSLQFWQVV